MSLSVISVILIILIAMLAGMGSVLDEFLSLIHI